MSQRDRSWKNEPDLLLDRPTWRALALLKQHPCRVMSSSTPFEQSYGHTVLTFHVWHNSCMHVFRRSTWIYKHKWDEGGKKEIQEMVIACLYDAPWWVDYQWEFIIDSKRKGESRIHFTNFTGWVHCPSLIEKRERIRIPNRWAQEETRKRGCAYTSPSIYWIMMS